MTRVLRFGGMLTIEVPDFEWRCATFLVTKDEWRAFYVVRHTFARSRDVLILNVPTGQGLMIHP